MIEVLLSNGDSAQADTPEDAVYAARTILREAVEHGASYQTLTATFVGPDGSTVRSGLSVRDLGDHPTTTKGAR